jgi:tetratricopeptide (TPR) repeat protein
LTFTELRALWDFNDPVASEAVFDALLADCAEEDRPVILTQKARAQGLQRRFGDARATLGVVLPLEDSEWAAAYWIELGRIENSSGNATEAIPCFLKSLEISERVGAEFLAVDAAHMLGISEKGEAGLEWNMKAISMAEAATNEMARDWLGSLLNNTGWSFYELGEYDMALDLFQKALAFRISKGVPNPIFIARYCVGKCLRAMGQIEQALELQQELEKDHLQMGSDPGYVYEEIAECLHSLGREDEAKPYFKMAYEGLRKDEWLMAEEPARVDRLGNLARASA